MIIRKLELMIMVLRTCLQGSSSSILPYKCLASHWQPLNMPVMPLLLYVIMQSAMLNSQDLGFHYKHSLEQQ